MKSKVLIVVFVAIFLCSALNVALAIAAQCPTCGGTGKVPCPDCDGTGKITSVDEGAPCEACSGTGTLPPRLTATIESTQPGDGKISVNALIQNSEDVEAFGKVTAKVESGDVAYEATSDRITFPPGEQTAVTVIIEGISDTDYRKLVETVWFGGENGTRIDRLLSSTQVSVSPSEVENIVCRYCNGTGLGSFEEDCPRCRGTGYITCPTCGGTGTESTTDEQNGALDIGGAVYGVAAVAVVAGVAVAAFVVVKQRRVKESDLRKLSPSEFQNWVLKKIGGKTSSQSDARMGIDGYTLDGQPLSIKQVNDVDRNVIENFAAAMGRRNAKNGTIVAFSFGTDAVRGRVRAKLNYGREIQMITVRDLIEGNRVL